MSSLLRSTKFVRYFCGAARTLILNSAKNVETNLLINSKNLCAANNVLVRDYASKKTESLEPLLQNMDFEIRRSGRISKRNFDELFDGIKSRNDISSSQSLLVIRCCGDILCEELPEKRTLLVQKIWSVLTEIGVPMDISHYNTLLRVYIENEHPFSPAEFLDELQNKGLQPNHVTYQRLMWRYCQQGDIEGATKVLENMRELGLPITAPVLNALVMGHANLGDTDGAKSVLHTVAGAGLEPTNHTYALLACGFARKGDLQGVRDVLNMAVDKDILMTNKDIFTIIEALAISGHSDKVDTMFDHLHQGPSYRHDAYNAILHLINKGQEGVAKEILKTIPKNKELEENFYQGAFFIKQLLRANKSADQIVQACRDLKQDSVIPNALLIALEGSLQQGNIQLSQQLLHELSEMGMEIRQHYYWPILAHKGREHDDEGLLQALRDMSNNNLAPSRETLQNYVVPYLLRGSTPQNVMVKLQIAGVPTIVSAKSVVAELLQDGKIRQAADITKEYNLKGNTYMREALCSALIKTRDVDSFATILQVTSARVDIAQTDESSTQDDQSGADKVGTNIDSFIIKAVKGFKAPELCEKLLNTLLHKGIGVSPQAAETIQEFLGQNMTASLLEILTKLTSNALELAPVQRSGQTNFKSASQLEQIIANNKEMGTDLQLHQKQLIFAYINEKNGDKLKELVKQLEGENFQFTSTVLSALMEFYAENDDIEKALHYKELLESTYPDYKLYNFKLMHLALGYIKANRVDEAIELLKSNTSDGSNFFAYNSKCWQVLNELAEQKNPAKVKELFQVMIEKKYIEPSNILLGPLIKVHLMKDDLEAALSEFEECAMNFRSTPWKGELMKQLIVSENAAKLQWLADLSTKIHGEVNVLYDLVLAFVECGRLRQARRILETPGLHMRTQRIDNACKRYADDGKTECIEGLLEATKELSNIDRSKIFYHLLTSYCSADETDKALGLWSLLQEEGEVPSDEFLSKLGEHLLSKGREVPFVVPVKMTMTKAKDTVRQAQASVSQKNHDYSKKIEKLLENNQLDEAVELALKCLKENVQPDRMTASFLLKKLAEVGNVEKILMLRPYYENERKPINYHQKLVLAKVLSGFGSQVVEELQISMKSAESIEEFENVMRCFPRSESLNIIIKDEHLANKCEDIAKALATKDHILPVNLMWMEYIINGQEQRADVLWNQHLKNCSHIKFKRLLQYSFTANQPELMEKLIKCLKSNSHVTPEAIGNVYSRLIGLYTTQGELSKAKDYINQAVADGLTLDKINLTAWKNLKNACLSKGEEFNYDVPQSTKKNQ